MPGVLALSDLYSQAPFNLLTRSGHFFFPPTYFFIFRENNPPLHSSIPKSSILFQSQLSAKRNTTVLQAVESFLIGFFRQHLSFPHYITIWLLSPDFPLTLWDSSPLDGTSNQSAFLVSNSWTHVQLLVQPYDYPAPPPDSCARAHKTLHEMQLPSLVPSQCLISIILQFIQLWVIILLTSQNPVSLFSVINRTPDF